MSGGPAITFQGEPVTSAPAKDVHWYSGPRSIAIPVPLALREPLARMLRSESHPTEITVTRTGEATFAQAARRTSTVLAGAGAGTVFVDGEPPTPLQLPRHAPAPPAPLYGQGFLEPIARKMYEARMAGYTPNAGVAAPMGAPMPWGDLTEGTRELWRNVASVAVLHLTELSPPTLDLSPAEVEALDQGVKAALTVGMLDPARSVTDKDATAKVLQYIADQRQRFATAAAAGEQLTFAPAPSYPAMVQELLNGDVPLVVLPADNPKASAGTFARATEALKAGVQQLRGETLAAMLCRKPISKGKTCMRLANHSDEGGCIADPERAAELDKRDFKAAR